MARARAWAARSTPSSASAGCTLPSWGRPAREANARRPPLCRPASQPGIPSPWAQKKKFFFLAPGDLAGTGRLSRSAAAWRGLAMRAKEGASAALDDALDGSTAGRAGLTGAVVDEEEVLPALLDVGDGLRAVLFVQRSLDCFLDGLGEPPGVLAVQRSAGALRAQFRAVQRFGNEDVAQPGEDALVHQRFL